MRGIPFIALAASMLGAGAIVMVGDNDNDNDNDNRLQLAAESGTTHLFKSTETDPAEAILELTHGRGTDAIIDSIGTDASITHDVTRAGATLSVIGVRLIFEPPVP